MNKFSLSALFAAGLLAGGLSTSASAADLGGDCCADLEERVAELEATTVRKGNRKVSLTISGWVGEEVMYFDDGVEENVFQQGLGSTLSTNFKLSGSAQITPGWSAGYLIHVEVGNGDNLGINAAPGNDDTRLVLSGGSGVQVLQNYWFVKSDTIGKLSVGTVSQASDNTAILVDGSGSLVAANWVAFGHNSFAIRNSTTGGTTGTWGGAGPCHGMGGAWGDCNGLTQNGVRYDSPTFGGFSVSAGWGEDDFWDVAARYAGEFGGIKVAASAAYNEVTDVDLGAEHAAGSEAVQYFQAGLYLQHVPTGLFVLGNYGHIEDDGALGEEADTYYIKAGIRAKLNPLGATVFYGEYLNNEADSTAGTGFLNNAAATGSELDVYGAGIVQEIDAAAMSVWLRYRHLEYDDSTANNYEDFDSVSAGALIAF